VTPSNRRRILTAEEINEQLDEIAEAVRQGVPQLISGIFFGAPSSRRSKPRPQKPRQDGGER
jgi:hypothetical protein